MVPPKPTLIAKSIVSGIAMLALSFHVFSDRHLDTPALVLVFLALVPWLASVISRAELPGGPDGNGRIGTVQVVIEVKGCWNRARETDLSDQLRDRYLRENQCRHGLYVIGWFTCDQWDKKDRTRRRAPTQTAAEACSHFDDLARAASGEGVLIESFILNAQLR